MASGRAPRHLGCEASGTRLLWAQVIRLAAILLLSQSTHDVGFSFFGRLAKPGDTSRVGGFRPRLLPIPNVRRLAALPPGLVAADIDLGPFIVALSPHRVVAAPYHRLDKGVLANDAILHSAPDQAMPHLRSLGVSYVVLCADRPMRGNDNSLHARLLGSQPPEFLRELDLLPGTPIPVWKVAPVL